MIFNIRRHQSVVRASDEVISYLVSVTLSYLVSRESKDYLLL